MLVKRTYPEEKMRLDSHTDFLGALLHLRDGEGVTKTHIVRTEVCVWWGAVHTHSKTEADYF